jgi:hypothetical protein
MHKFTSLLIIIIITVPPLIRSSPVAVSFNPINHQITRRQIYEHPSKLILGVWQPHGYFNLCPFVRPLPLDPVWNQGCRPIHPFFDNNHYRQNILNLQQQQQNDQHYY